MMSKNLSKFFIIYNELKKYNCNNFCNNEIIKATKDLIKYSKEEYLDKSEISNKKFNNIQPIDEYFENKNLILKKTDIFYPLKMKLYLKNKSIINLKQLIRQHNEKFWECNGA